MSQFLPSHLPVRTCAETGHACAPEVMYVGGYITQKKKEEIECDTEVCIPDLGTLPSSVLNILDETNNNKSLLRRFLEGSLSFIPSFGPAGQSADYNAPPPLPEEYIWAVWRNDHNTKRSITDFLIANGYTIKRKPRILLYIVPDGSHYVLINEDGTINDPSSKEDRIPFDNIPITPYYYTLILATHDDSETSEMYFMNSTDRDLLELEKDMINLINTQLQSKLQSEFEIKKLKRLRELEEQNAEISRKLKELEQPTKKRGGKTNTKKKYRAKTLVSTNKYAKRPRIRRSRRKSKSNRINNGKH